MDIAWFVAQIVASFVGAIVAGLTVGGLLIGLNVRPQAAMILSAGMFFALATWSVEVTSLRIWIGTGVPSVVAALVLRRWSEARGEAVRVKAKTAKRRNERTPRER